MTGNDSSNRMLKSTSHRTRATSLAGVLAAACLAGCGRSANDDSSPLGLMVYVDLETKAPVVQLGTEEVPAVHPETGRRTLMPGLYCPKCERWHPTPPFDTLQRTPGAGRCPEHDLPLTSDGPWPQGDEE